MPHYLFTHGPGQAPIHCWESTATDYTAWVKELQSFVSGLGTGRRSSIVEIVPFSLSKAVPTDHFRSFQASIGFDVPNCLSLFFQSGCRDVGFIFETNLGGKSVTLGHEQIFCLDRLAEWRADCLTHLNSSWLREYPWVLDRAFWQHAIPFGRDHATNMLALWFHSKDDDDPAVVYLRHDEGSWIVAPRFSYFLHHWSQLCYIHPSFFEAYCDSDTGFIDSTTAEADDLRKLVRAL
jgi:hypothetical protein